MNIPAPIRKPKPLTYPFDKVEINKPFDVAVPGKGDAFKKKQVSVSNSARQYAKRAGKKFVIRSNEKGITIYRTK